MWPQVGKATPRLTLNHKAGLTLYEATETGKRTTRQIGKGAGGFLYPMEPKRWKSLTYCCEAHRGMNPQRFTRRIPSSRHGLHGSLHWEMQSHVSKWDRAGGERPGQPKHCEFGTYQSRPHTHEFHPQALPAMSATSPERNVGDNTEDQL